MLLTVQRYVWLFAIVIVLIGVSAVAFLDAYAPQHLAAMSHR